MSTNAPQSEDVKALFKRWRSGDAEAGVTMAQRFSDWYYAITLMRLGDARARAPLERACQTFAQRIMEVENADDLIEFAHRIVLDEIQDAGGRVEGGDYPNALTANRSPSELLQEASGGGFDRATLEILHHTYGERRPLNQIGTNGHGSMPLAALQARHALKQWLRQNARVPFTVLSEDPDLDRAPLPLYEANHLASPDEEHLFEQWLLSDIDLCKDVAEFSAFAHAMRSGALKNILKPARRPTPKTEPPNIRPSTNKNPSDTAAVTPSAGARVNPLIVGIVAITIVGSALAFYFFGI